MKRPTKWPLVFAYTGLAFMGLVLANFATTVTTSGIAAGNLGSAEGGRELITSGSFMLLAGIAMMAIFGYLALTTTLAQVRTRRRELSDQR